MKNEMVDSINVDYDMNDTLLSVHRGPYKEGQYVDEGAYIIFEWEERDPEFEEIYKLEHTPHPIEFEMYYSQ